jgi:hypothetical protein
MPKLSKPSKKHHFVPQAQLRHFAQDVDQRSIWVFDKRTDRAWVSSLLNAGSENDFNTVELDAGKWNFEDIFSAVDSRSAWLVSRILDRRSVEWIEVEERAALIDLFSTQMLRTSVSRTSPRHVAGEMRKLVRDLGYDPDADPKMGMPSDASLRIGAVRSFLDRGRIARSMVRLIPALFTARADQRFVLSDNPVVIANAFPYGDVGLEAHGITVILPIAPDLAVSLVCPTIIDRFEAIDRAGLDPDRYARMALYRDGFRSGRPIELEAAELDGWNNRQVMRSARYLYAAEDNFDFARRLLKKHPELRQVDSHIRFGEMGMAPPVRQGMPAGLQLVIQGKADHCLIPIAEIDQLGEGLTVRTTSLELLRLVAADMGVIRAELYDSGQPRQLIGAAMIERFGDPTEGWFRVVHADESMRSLARHLDAQRQPDRSD